MVKDFTPFYYLNMPGMVDLYESIWAYLKIIKISKSLKEIYKSKMRYFTILYQFLIKNTVKLNIMYLKFADLF